MESSSFQTQLLSVMDVLAKAAVAEINRRVDDSCAVLRMEVSRSRSDIDLLKRKCEVMEAELRRTRMRVRRKVFYPPAADIFSPLVKVVLNKERQITAWDRQADDEAPTQPQQLTDEEPVNEDEAVQIKEECADEDVWKNNAEHKLISEAEQPACFEASQPAQGDSFVECYHSPENTVDLGPLLSPAGGYDTFPEQQLNRNQSEAEPVVKHEKEEEPDENAAPLDSGQFVMQEADGQQLWSPSDLGGDAVETSFPQYVAGQQYEQIPPVFTSLSGLVEMVPRIHSVGKSHAVMMSAARAKRRARTFGFKRAQQDEGHGALSQINSMDTSSIPPQTQHQYRDSAPHMRDLNEDPMALNPVASLSFGLARRMRTPWRSGGLGEKRFSCTYCDKSFMRFSQLKEHLRSHTGEKPFSCMQCGRSFTKQCNLIRHAVVHSGEKPYECSLCGKCFTQRSSLKSHQKTAH